MQNINYIRPFFQFSLLSYNVYNSQYPSWCYVYLLSDWLATNISVRLLFIGRVPDVLTANDLL